MAAFRLSSVSWALLPWVMAAFTMAAMPLGQFATQAWAAVSFSCSKAFSTSVPTEVETYSNLKSDMLHHSCSAVEEDFAVILSLPSIMERVTLP